MELEGVQRAELLERECVGDELLRREVESLIASHEEQETFLAAPAVAVIAKQMAEARAASALNHPNILAIYEIGQEAGRHYIVTEFVDGETLRQHCERAKVTLSDALDIAIQVAGALSAAHEAGVGRRDIKPDNLMLRRDGYVKVLDFGLAKLVEKAPEGPPEAEIKLSDTTTPGVAMGTVAYMSPEQARGLKVDARTDI